MKRSGRRERNWRRIVDRWAWHYRTKSGRYAAVVATVSDTGVLNVKTRRPHLVPPAERERAADALEDFVEAWGFDHEQRYYLIWGA